ncbi:hypothetical protein CFIMG_004736RA [Ceratocystis fimbriata CBS 114723]|uniref:BZIP domain-containing protein n=1 Tax=Ceratocystis fimbriata CBS 114723 TaxID=1035309 RepID=A0A2C5WVY1_9PEZI|nr:hypothetical protein CFIMG_004736RA [Ceratocystis fimbriata CBS 114723]
MSSLSGSQRPASPPFNTAVHSSSAFCPEARPDEDWTKESDLATRRRLQNRIAQRNYRKRKREEKLETDRRNSGEAPDSHSLEQAENRPRRRSKHTRTPSQRDERDNIGHPDGVLPGLASTFAASSRTRYPSPPGNMSSNINWTATNYDTPMPTVSASTFLPAPSSYLPHGNISFSQANHSAYNATPGLAGQSAFFGHASPESTMHAHSPPPPGTSEHLLSPNLANSSPSPTHQYATLSGSSQVGSPPVYDSNVEYSYDMGSSVSSQYRPQYHGQNYNSSYGMASVPPACVPRGPASFYTPPDMM